MQPPSYNQVAHVDEKATETEIKLWHSSKERQDYDVLADFFVTIVATQRLESMWGRGNITDEVYTNECKRLITQFKSQSVNASAALSKHYGTPDIEKFWSLFNLNADGAKQRLLVEKVPATVFHGQAKAKGVELTVAQTVQNFITTLDALEMGLKSTDEVQPKVKQLMESLSKNNLPADHKSMETVKKWLLKLNQMSAAAELNEEECRQIAFDLDDAYHQYYKFVEGKE